jgi:hypothetical protein
VDRTRLEIGLNDCVLDEGIEEVKCLDMRGEGIWRNDEMKLHRRDSWVEHVLRRYMTSRRNGGRELV